MALLQSLKRRILKAGDVMKLYSAFIHDASKITGEMGDDVPKPNKEANITSELLSEIQKSRKESDMPIEMENPFTEENPQCILCKYDIEPNFKNVRLLSQFVSSYTGRVYGRYITGLCKEKQQKVETEIQKAQASGLMGHYVKDPNFLNDPDLYDPSKPFKVL